MREWIGIFLGLGIQFPEVNTKAHSPPSFLWTNTTTLHQGLLDGLIALASNISLMCCLTLSSKGGGMHLKCSLKGSLSSISILCFTVLVQPSLFLPSKNTS